MKRIAVILTLALVSVGAAHAETPTLTLSDIADQMTTNASTYDAGFWTGAVLGYTQDPKVCSGNTLIGSIEAQLGGEIRNYVSAHPDKDKSLSIVDATHVVLEMMKIDYPCK